MAAYPQGLTKTIVDQWFRAAAMAYVRRTQAHAMVRTGRWGNALVTHGTTMDAKLVISLGYSAGIVVLFVLFVLFVLITKSVARPVTGLARVTELTAQRGTKRKPDLAHYTTQALLLAV